MRCWRISVTLSHINCDSALTKSNYRQVFPSNCLFIVRQQPPRRLILYRKRVHFSGVIEYLGMFVREAPAYPHNTRIYSVLYNIVEWTISKSNKLVESTAPTGTKVGQYSNRTICPSNILSHEAYCARYIMRCRRCSGLMDVREETEDPHWC